MISARDRPIIDLYKIDEQPVRIRDIQANIIPALVVTVMTDWSWIDAIQMAMPVFAQAWVF